MTDRDKPGDCLVLYHWKCQIVTNPVITPPSSLNVRDCAEAPSSSLAVTDGDQPGDRLVDQTGDHPAT